MDIIRGLKDISETPITSMGASWETIAYEFGHNLHLCVHVYWSNPSPQGILYLEYTGDPSPIPESWILKDSVILNGTFQEHMFLDSDLAVYAFRLRFVHSSGGGAMESYIIKKRGY
jgi:hypothetical protein